MKLPRSLLKEFADATNDVSEKKETPKYVKGTITGKGASKYVKIDGSPVATPISETMVGEEGDRVLVSIENHKAIVLGNFSLPSDPRKEQDALNKAEDAQTNSNAAMEAAKDAQESAKDALESSSTASAQAQEAQKKAEESLQASNTASQKAEEAKQESAQAQQDAANAKDNAADALAGVANAREEIDRINENVDAVQGEIDGALEDLKTQAGEIAGIKETYTTKVETENVKAELTTEISKQVGELKTTVEQTYAAKNDVVEMEGKLQTQITQNAQGIQSQASKVEKLESDTEEAQKRIDEALEKADMAQIDADKAQEAATRAQAAADKAEENALIADQKAQEAQKLAAAARDDANKADQALADARTELDEAQKNFEEVKNNPSSTQEEIKKAEELVDAAQEAVDKALSDAADAEYKANQAEEAAANAQIDAQQAQQAATDAQEKADQAKVIADKALAEAEAAQKEIAELTHRVTEAETTITQNSEQIELNANKTEEIGDKLKNDYYNKAETDAKFTVESDRISQSVTETVTTEMENRFSEMELENRNLAQLTNRGDTGWGWNISPYPTTIETVITDDGTNAVKMSLYPDMMSLINEDDIDQLEISHNPTEIEPIVDGEGTKQLKFTINTAYNGWTVKKTIPNDFIPNEKYTVSFNVKYDIGTIQKAIAYFFAHPVPSKLETCFEMVEDGSLQLPADEWCNMKYVFKAYDNISDYDDIVFNFQLPDVVIAPNIPSHLYMTEVQITGKFKSSVEPDWSAITYDKLSLSRFEPNEDYTVSFDVLTELDTKFDITVCDPDGTNSIMAVNGEAQHQIDMPPNPNIFKESKDWGSFGIFDEEPVALTKYIDEDGFTVLKYTSNKDPFTVVRGPIIDIDSPNVIPITNEIVEKGFTLSVEFKYTDLEWEFVDDEYSSINYILDNRDFFYNCEIRTGYIDDNSYYVCEIPNFNNYSLMEHTEKWLHCSNDIEPILKNFKMDQWYRIEESVSPETIKSSLGNMKPDSEGLFYMGISFLHDTHDSRWIGNIEIRKPKIEVGQKATDYTESTETIPLEPKWKKLSAHMKTKAELPDLSNQVLYFSGMSSSPGDSYQFKNLKIERGIKGTQWTEAPEDVETSLREEIDETAKIITEQYTSLIDQTSKQIDLMVQSLKKETDANSESITSVSNQLQITTEMAQFVKTTTEQLQNAVDGKISETEIREWARFDGAELELGASNSAFKSVLTNTKLSFEYGGKEIAYISGDGLKVLKAIITESIGCGNFMFKDEGSLGFSLT